jgi:hypothetical protein
MDSNRSWFIIILDIIRTIVSKIRGDKEKEKIAQQLAEKLALEQQQKENEKINADLNNQYQKINEEAHSTNTNSSIIDIKDKLNDKFK